MVGPPTETGQGHVTSGHFACLTGMSTSPHVTSSMLEDAKQCLRQRDYDRARALAKTILAYNPDDSEAIQVLVAAEQGKHGSSLTDGGFASSDSIGDIKGVILCLGIFVLGVLSLYRGIQVGWNGTLTSFRRPTYTYSGSALIIGGVVASAVSGTFLVIGFRRFRLY